MDALAAELADFKIRLSDFEIGKQIGHGGFSEVYLGMEVATGRLCAIKILNAKDLRGDSFVVYEREVRILWKGRSRFILTFVGFTTTYPYTIVTEYASRGSLYDALHHKAGAPVLTGTQKTIIAMGVAYALNRLHKIRVIHRDLKSLNVLLDSACLPKVCDFGLSRWVKNPDTFLTVDIGTPHWMAPELFEKHDYTNKVVVYSDGILVWELASGSYPYKGQSPLQIAYAVCKLHERPEIPHRAPRSIRALIQDCWAHDPAVRPSFKNIFRKFAGGEAKFMDTDAEAVVRMVQTLEDDEANADSPPTPKADTPDSSEKHHLPEELKSDKPPPQIVAIVKDTDLDPIRDCFAPAFLENLQRIRVNLNPIHAEPFFSILIQHLKDSRKVMRLNVAHGILATTAELIASPHYFQYALEMKILDYLPYDQPEFVDPIFHILVAVFSQAPTAVHKSVFDSLQGLIRIRPLHVLKLVNIYTCLHPPLPLFWSAADILILKAESFQGPDVLEQYLRLVFTLSRLVDVFRTGRFKYLVTILLRAISTSPDSCRKLAFDILSALLSKSCPEPIKIDTGIFVHSLKDSRYTFSALSVLARLPQQQPTYELVLALLTIARQGELASLLLCQYCEIEMVAVKLAEISSQWISYPLPTIEHTVQLLLVIMCHQRARPYFMYSPGIQQFLASILATRRADLIDAVGTIQMAFPLGPDLIQKMRESQFLRQYMDAAYSLNNAQSMMQCLDLVKMVAKVAYEDDFMLLLPLLKNFLHPTAGWHEPSISLLATLSRHEPIRREIIRQGITELVSAVSSTDGLVLKRIQKFRKNMERGV
jgi:serine/threonine protein kinase